MEPRAIIFDCDGTLADTMPAHYEAWSATLSRYQLPLSEDRFYALGGWPTHAIIELLKREHAATIDTVRVANEKEAAFESMIAQVVPIEPVVEVVRRYHGKLPMAVATGAFRWVCEKILRQIGIYDFFQTVVSCEDVTLHKPAPDIFLEAARRLGIEPRYCRVYEDTDPGCEAARRAGMDCVDVRQFYVPRRVSSQ